jgi:hypothetical protein
MSTGGTDTIERLRNYPDESKPELMYDARMEIERLRAALIRARGFIQNGIALGYIRMPDPDTPDTAHEVPGIIDAALGMRS